MTSPQVRIRKDLYDSLAKRAKTEKRSIQMCLENLLEQELQPK